VADEIFFCGTGAEVQAVSEIDGYRVGDGRIGPVTARIERAFHDLVRGRSAHEHHRIPVYGTRVAAR
jgi:branched-chain amino acid aminotransferase